MVPIVSCQALYNLLERNPATYHAISLEYRTEKEVLPYCRDKGLAFFPYSPLFQGLLTGSFTRQTRFTAEDVRSENPKLSGPRFERYLAAADALKLVAKGEGLSLTELSLGWLCNRPEVTSVICGAQDPEQIAANASASEVVLSEAVLNRMDEIVADVDRVPLSGKLERAGARAPATFFRGRLSCDNKARAALARDADYHSRLLAWDRFRASKQRGRL